MPHHTTHTCTNAYKDISIHWRRRLAAQSCPTLSKPMGCSTPGFPVRHHLPEFAQTHVHRVSDAIQPSCPLLSPLLLPSIFLSRVFSKGSTLHIRWPKYLNRSIWFQYTDIKGSSASASVLPMNIQDWFTLGLTGLVSLQSKGLSKVFSDTTVQKLHQSMLSLLYGPTLTSIHDYWKNHSFDYTDICWQSNVSAF